MANKKSKLFPTNPNKLLFDERVSRIVLPTLSPDESFLEEDSEDPLLFSEDQEVEEEPPEEATTLKVFLGVPSLNEAEDRDTVFDEEQGHVWDLSELDGFDDFDPFDDESEEEDSPQQADNAMEVESVESIVGGSLREFIDRPIHDVVLDDPPEQDPEDSEEWDGWEDDDWGEFSLSTLLSEPNAAEQSPILTPQERDDEEIPSVQAEEEDSEVQEAASEDDVEREGLSLPYFGGETLLEPILEEEEKTVLNIAEIEEVVVEPELDDDPITQESEVLVSVDEEDSDDWDDGLEGYEPAESLKPYDTSMMKDLEEYLEEQPPFWKEPMFVIFMVIGLLALAFLMVVLTADVG